MPSPTSTVAATFKKQRSHKKKSPIPAPEHVRKAAYAALEHALTQGATVIVIAWETPTHISFAAVPKSQSVIAGLIGRVAHRFGWRPALPNEFYE